MIFSAVALSIIFFFLFFRMNVLVSGLQKLMSILQPFIYGAVIAYLLRPICKLLEKLLSRLFGKFLKPRRAASTTRVVSIAFSLLFGGALMYVLFAMVMPQLIESISAFVEAVPDTFDMISEWANSILDDNPVIVNYVNRFTTDFEKTAIDFIQNNLLPNMETIVDGFSSTVSSVVEIVTNLVIGLVVSVYLLSGRMTFKSQVKTVINCIFRPKWAEKVFEELRYADKTISGFINGKIITSCIFGIVCFIFLQIFNMPYPMLLSVFIAVTNIIPFFGPFIGAVPSAIIIFLSDPWQCLWFVIFIVLAQQIEGNIIEPRVIGSTTGMSSFWVLFAIILFGGLFGFVGMIAGVPVFAVIYDILRKLLKRGVQKRRKVNEERERIAAKHKSVETASADK